MLRSVPIPEIRPESSPSTQSPVATGRQPLSALTELAGCVMFGVACADMVLGVYTLIRAALYLIAVALAFAGAGFKLRMPALGWLFLLAGGLYLLKALLYPPVPMLVRSDIRNILVGSAFLATLNLADLTAETWEHFQLKVHRTVLSVATVGAVLGLAKFMYFIQGGIVPSLMDPERGYPLGSSLQVDYNFYSLPLLMGIFSAFWLMKRDPSSLWRTGALLSVPALVGGVLLSGSRRGLTIVVIAAPLLLLWALLSGKGTALPENGGKIRWKTLAVGLALVAGIGVLKRDALDDFAGRFLSADSLVQITQRWETFQDGTYSDSRLNHWSIALDRLARFRPLQYLFGEGFAYVTDLGADPEVEEDYPHNFLLSSMLYGGLVQTTCLVLMLAMAMSRLARRAAGSGMLCAWFLLLLYYLSTSCNSFFSSEAAVFLAVVGLGVKRFGPKRVVTAEFRSQGLYPGLHAT